MPPASPARASQLADASLSWPDTHCPESGTRKPTLGGVVSGGGVTVQVRLAGLPSVLPAALVARTENVCDPAARPVKLFGERQGTQMPRSSLDSKLDPAALEENEKLALELVTVPLGPERMVVSGGLRLAGVEQPQMTTSNASAERRRARIGRR